jgi:hypothetical protein
MADEKDKHTPESVAAKVVKALLKVKPEPKKRKTRNDLHERILAKRRQKGRKVTNTTKA